MAHDPFTQLEQEVLSHLQMAYDKYHKLTNLDPTDTHLLELNLQQAQRVIANRALKRQYPKAYDNLDKALERGLKPQIKEPEITTDFPIVNKEKLKELMHQLETMNWDPNSPADKRAFTYIKGTIQNTIFFRGYPQDIKSFVFPDIQWTV